MNVGGRNPKTHKPDFGCGKLFTKDKEGECKIHPGYLEDGKTWKCCGGNKNNVGCVIGTHKVADWPDEVAKLNFYPKPIINPGVKDEEKINIGFLIANSDFFKEVLPYDDALSKQNRENAKKVNQKLQETQPRYNYI